MNSQHGGAGDDPFAGANIFWGSPSGFDLEKRRTVLRERNLASSTVADLDRDGFLDLVLGAFTLTGRVGPIQSFKSDTVPEDLTAGVLHAIGRKGDPPQIPLNLLGDFAGNAGMLETWKSERGPGAFAYAGAKAAIIAMSKAIGFLATVSSIVLAGMSANASV